jgi:hypothetical protein
MRAGPRAKHNLLRPEALEAMYILWRTTGESRYREWGWQMFVAFLRWCKVGSITRGWDTHVVGNV